MSIIYSFFVDHSRITLSRATNSPSIIYKNIDCLNIYHKKRFYKPQSSQRREDFIKLNSIL